MTDERIQQAAQGGSDLIVFIEELNQERDQILEDILFTDTRKAAKRLAEIDAQMTAAKTLARLHQVKKRDFMAGMMSAVN